MTYAKCPTCHRWSDDSGHTDVAAKLAAAEDRAEQAVLLATALSDGLAGELGPEGPIRKIIKRLQAAELMAEAANKLLKPDLDGPGDIWEASIKPLSHWRRLEQALAAWNEAQ